MRWKIIAVNSIIVLLVGVLSYALLRAALGDLASNPAQLKAEAERALSAANTKLELDAVRAERWLATMANEKASREIFKAGTVSARQEEATEYSNRLLSAAVSYPVFDQMAPTFLGVVDANGIALGRNGTNLGRGEDLAAGHPSLSAAIAQGVTATDVWADNRTSQLMSVSYAPVRDDDRKVLGVLLVGTPLTDGRLQRTSELTSGRGLILGIPSGAGAAANIDLKAKSATVSPVLLTALGQSPLKEAVAQTVATGHGAFLTGGPTEDLLTAAPLSGYGDGKRAVLIAVSPSSLIESINGLLWPVLAVTGLGILLVCLGGFLLGNYLSRPVEELEEGLLAILNGRTDLRFEIEHAELGGLVFRLNSLLNQLMGVQEDDTDEEGRPSRPPKASDFSDALAVDERSVQAANVDAGLVAALRAEPADSYYGRLFREYIAAKRSLGDPTEHITEATFVGRIRTSESEMTQKHGKPVRYRVETRGREVVLIAVPLS
jgi:hypothetical protein